MKTIVIELHGFRRDYIQKDTTPFLYFLKEEWSISSLKPTFGLDVYPSVWTGVYPDKHHHVFKFILENREKLNLRKILPLKVYNLFINLYRYVKDYDFYTTFPHDKRVGKFSLNKKYIYFHKNPFNVKSIFDIFRNEGKQFLYYEHPLFGTNNSINLFYRKAYDEKRTDIFIKKLNDEKDFYFMLLRYADIYGHRYGPESKEIREIIKIQDNCVKMIFDKVNSKGWKNYNIIIFANYGMLDVRQTINLEEKLPRWGKGYLYFLDSNYARFWLFDENIKDNVINILNSVSHGHIITAQEKKKYHIDFNHSKFGEIIFIVDQYYAIYPNFFDKTIPKGLHSYNLKNQEEYGFIMSNRPIKNNAKVIDIAPTIIDMMNICYSETQFDGKSLLLR